MIYDANPFPGLLNSGFLISQINDSVPTVFFLMKNVASNTTGGLLHVIIHCPWKWREICRVQLNILFVRRHQFGWLKGSTSSQQHSFWTSETGSCLQMSKYSGANLDLETIMVQMVVHNGIGAEAYSTLMWNSEDFVDISGLYSLIVHSPLPLRRHID